MSLKEVLQEDLKSAMREKDVIRKNVVTMMRAAILQIEKDKKIELDDEGVIEVIAKGVKQRKDSIPEFEKGNRPDLVEGIEKEIGILMGYLPQQLTEDEINQIVTDTIFEVGAQGIQDLGKVMNALKSRIKGRADGKLVNSVVREHLQK
ncbi:MAG TPA: GatB/YqeY domain-containing protein [Patescibacteria group bacterium]|nr:GatB/YqeY domain-containing protein [Patescibacteria group bacterium]